MPQVQITGKWATKRIELDQVNNARLLASKEMCRLDWQRHNEIRNKITHRMYVGNSHPDESRPCEYTKKSKANQGKSRAHARKIPQKAP